MNAALIRGMAIGIFLSASIFFGYQVINPNQPVEKKKEQTSIPSSMNMNEAKLELEKEGYKIFTDSEWNAYQAEQKKKSEQSKAESTTSTLNIKSGMPSEAVLDQLKKNGIIPKNDEFKHYLENKDLARKIRPGTYIVTKEMDYQTLAAILTRGN